MSNTAPGDHTQQPQKSDGEVGGKGSEKTPTSAAIKDSDQDSNEALGTETGTNGRVKNHSPINKKVGRSQCDFSAAQKRVPEDPQMTESDVPCSSEFVAAVAEAGNMACAKDVACKPGNQKEPTYESMRKAVKGQNKAAVGKNLMYFEASNSNQTTSENQTTNMATAHDDEETSFLMSGSDAVYDNICQPCKNDGKLLEADGRCEDCDEFLCKRCFLSHTIPSMMRNHVMVGKYQLHQGAAPGERDQCTQPCPQHNDEMFKYRCWDLYTSYKARKLTVEIKASEITKHFKTQIDTVNRYQAAAVEKMNSFKEECVAMFERTEQENVTESERIKRKELYKQKKFQDISVAVSKDIKDITSQIEGFESKKQYYNMFKAMLKAQGDLNSYEDKLSEVDLKDELPRKVFFIPNPGLDEWLAADGIGKIVENPLEVNAMKHDRSIHVKTQSDANTCWISGSAILPGNKLIITDSNNYKLKVIDFQQNKVVEELQMSSHPWAVTATRHDHVAVTLPHESKIAIVETDGKLVHNRTIVVDGECRGVAYNDRNLVVLFGKPCKIELMDMEGHVLKTIATNTSEKKVMDEPVFVAINSASETVLPVVYVTDVKLGNVLCFTSNGKLVTTYTDKNLNGPMGMTIDGRGRLYVCDWVKNNVHQITMNGKHVRILLTKNDVTRPYTISYSDIESKFYIGMRDRDIVKVFNAVY